MSVSGETGELSARGRFNVLIVAFLGWLFAGLQIALFVLIHRPAMLSLLTASDPGGGSEGLEQAIKQWFAWYQAAFLLGAASGGWIFGIVGDRYGRTRALGWSILCYTGFTALCYFAGSPRQLLILRFLACQGVGGAWPNTVALVAEAWPAASRPLLAGLLGTAANFGQVLMGAIGVQFDVTPESWRWTFLVAAAPFVIGLWCLLAVPESQRWLASRAGQKSNRTDNALRELFRPPFRSRTVMGILLGAVPVIGTAANAQWIVPWTDQFQSQANAPESPAQPEPGAHTAPIPPNVDDKPARTRTAAKPDPKSKARTMMSRSGGAVFGSLLGGLLAGLLGRRLTYFLISLLSLLASTWVFGWLNPGHPWFQWAVFAFGLVGTVYFGWLPLYLPELFPTRLRATGTGISFNTGRAIAAIIALGTGIMLGWFGGDYAKIGLWTGMIYALGVIIIFFAPRTDSASLQD